MAACLTAFSVVPQTLAIFSSRRTASSLTVR